MPHTETSCSLFGFSFADSCRHRDLHFWFAWRKVSYSLCMWEFSRESVTPLLNGTRGLVRPRNFVLRKSCAASTPRQQRVWNCRFLRHNLTKSYPTRDPRSGYAIFFVSRHCPHAFRPWTRVPSCQRSARSSSILLPLG
jgi:hypothetical protein